MASQKKVIIRQFVGPLVRGYLPASHILEHLAVQLLDLTGRVHPLPLTAVKSIAFVSDFNLNDKSEPERLGRRTFASRPRGPGLLLRVEFRDRDRIEGIAPADLGFFDCLVEDRCISIVPPDPRSNTYRLLLPRSALAAVEILSLAPASGKKHRQQAAKDLQNELFEQPSD